MLQNGSLSWQQHIQQIPCSGKAAPKRISRLACAHVHLIGLLLDFVSGQVEHTQDDDAALGSAQTHMAPVSGIHLDAAQSVLSTKVLTPQHSTRCSTKVVSPQICLMLVMLKACSAPKSLRHSRAPAAAEDLCFSNLSDVGDAQSVLSAAVLAPQHSARCSVHSLSHAMQQLC